MSVFKKLRTWIWIATTPAAFTILLAAPAWSASEAPVDDAPPIEGGHHVVTNPIQNFFSFSYSDKDDHGGKLEEGDHPMPPPFGAALINFGVLLFIIGKWFAPNIARMTKSRHDEIAKNLEEGARLRDEAKKRLEEYSGKLASLDKEIDTLVGSIRAEAEAEKKRIIGEAEARASRMQRDAEQQIEAEMQRVRVALEREAVLGAMAVAEKILREKTTEADQKALVDGFVKGLESAAGAGRVSKRT
jgi:F-type H+-transporting ATPase subunit b